MKRLIFAVLGLYLGNASMIHAMDISCLEGKTIFSKSVDSNSNPIDENLGTLTLTMKSNGKFLILDTKGPHELWRRGAYMMLTRKNHHYLSNTGDLKLIPMCDTNEMYLQFVSSNDGALFRKIQ